MGFRKQYVRLRPDMYARWAPIGPLDYLLIANPNQKRKKGSFEIYLFLYLTELCIFIFTNSHASNFILMHSQTFFFLEFMRDLEMNLQGNAAHLDINVWQMHHRQGHLFHSSSVT